MTRKKRLSAKTFGIARGPIKLKPTQVHKSKRIYNRVKEKIKLRTQITKTDSR